MADCSRPPAHNQQRKNLSSVFGFRNKGTYDDVFVSKPKMRAPAFKPVVNDYAEIFNCSKASSIPVLDLDVFEKREEVVDYGNVFGGMSEAMIGMSYEEVFGSNSGGVRRSTFDSYSHSRVSSQSIAAEERQKPPHDSLHEKKNSVPSDKFIGKKGNADETKSLAKTPEVPVPARAFDGTVPLKKDNVCRSGATTIKFQQESDEVPVGKHYRKASFSGLSKLCTDGFLDIDIKSRNGFGSNKSVSSETPTGENMIRPNLQMSEAISGTDSNLHLGGSMATSNSVLRNNTHEEGREGSDQSSNEGAHVQSMHGSKPFIREFTEVDTMMKLNVLRSKTLSSDYVHNHGTALANPAVVTGSSSARNSNGSDNGKRDGHQESSELTPNTQPRHSFSKTNTVSEDNIIPEITGSSQIAEKDSNGYLASRVKSEYEIENDNPTLKKASTMNSDVYKRSTYASVMDNNSSCASDDEIDKNSEASVSAAAVKRAIKEAQALINIAKVFNGVKGFMSLSMAKNSGKLKVVKEEQTKVEEKPKFFEPGTAEIKNNFSTSTARKNYDAPWSASSTKKMAPAHMVVEEVNHKRREFSELDNVNHMKAVELELQSSFGEKTQASATRPLKLPSVNSFQDKLAALHNTIADSEVNSSVHEVFLDNNHESCTVTSVTGAESESQNSSNNSDQNFMMQSFHDDFVQTEAGCSANSFDVKQGAVVVNEHTHANPNEAIEVESKGHISSDLTSFEEEDVKKSESDLTSFEEDIVKKSELDAQDQVSDYEDTDSQDYASAEENWDSTDTEDEISNMDHQFSTHTNLDEIEEVQNVVVTKVIGDVIAPRLNNLNEDHIVGEAADMSFQTIPTTEAQVPDEETTNDLSDLNPVVEETDKTDGILQNMVTREAEITSEEMSAPMFDNASKDPIHEEADESENATPSIQEVKLISEERAVPVFIYSNEDTIVEKADVTEDAPILFNVTPNVITPEDGSLSLLKIANEDPRVETEETEAMTEQSMETPEAIISFENDTASCFASSDEDRVVGDNAEHSTIESGVWLLDNKLDEGIMGAVKLHEQITYHIEDSVARVETEPASFADHESSLHVGSEVELICEDSLSVKSGADAIEASTSTPCTSVSEKQEADHTNFSDLDHQIDSEDFQNEIRVEADATEHGHETLNVTGFENTHVAVDAKVKDGAIDTESSSWNSEHVIDKLEAEVQFSDPVPDFNDHTEPSEFKQLSDTFIQSVERHERRKWEIPREKFELPELENGASDIQDTVNQDGIEMERPMDKPERKKWEIPNEAFELPVLDSEIVEENVGPVLDDEIVEENVEDVRPVLDDEIVENVGHETERAMQSAEKPERKKWNIQKEVLEVPIICAEVVEDTSDHEGLVLKTSFVEEIAMMDNVLDKPAETVKLDEVQNELSANDEVVPDKGASCEPFVENTEEDIAKHQQEINIVEGKVVGQEECTKVSEEINVKDEIKRTLGMFWKRILKVKQGEDSDVELAGKENATPSNKTGGESERDLNLNGPVQLVESPRQLDDNEAVSFSTNEESKEAASYSESFDVNHSSTCKIGDFVSAQTREEQRSSPLAFDSSKYQEGEKGSSDEEACNENYVAYHVKSQPEEVLSSSGSEDGTEMAPTHAACDLNKEGTQNCNIQPSNVNENGHLDSETVGESKPVLPDESLADCEEIIQKSTKVLQQNGLKNEDDDTSDENMSEAEVETHIVDDLSDRRCTDSEQRDTNSSRQDTDSASDSEVPDVTLTHEFEQKADKNETFPDRIEQLQTWKWIFGDDLKDKRNERDEESESEVKAKTIEPADDVHTSNATTKAKVNGDEPTSMEDTVPNSMHKEPDQDALKISMRAKELERIAVERAIREARERAFIDARERAAMERANAEAQERAAKEKTNLESRQRIALERANEARERAAMERANADARQRVNSTGQRSSSESNLASEKNSLEAKRKAEIERAAVERATTEARQRALEKAVSRKEQVTQSSSSRSTNTSNDQYGSSSNSKLNDDTCESALRFKARNERHQRIAERAAKALAEKNMRDLLVQREQAERNRLAEVLDDDVKIWSRGKTGNLRALLSTLQYVLGPDSGWRPIHLTEIVTADAVKKAYRRATLFVHPDKLQQRGATIRQKYICEKVFDLLKEAWTKFDRDER